MPDQTDAEPILFKELTATGLHERLAAPGRRKRPSPAAAGRRAPAGPAAVPAALPEVPRRLLDAVRAATAVPRLTRVEKVMSPTRRLRQVPVPRRRPRAVRGGAASRCCTGPATRSTSSASARRSAARMGCAFCATGRMGFRRNLATWEIVDQVMQVRADSPHPVRGVVFMGMGEPLLNYDRVMRRPPSPVRAVRPGHRRQGDHRSRRSASCR